MQLFQVKQKLAALWWYPELTLLSSGLQRQESLIIRAGRHLEIIESNSPYHSHFSREDQWLVQLFCKRGISVTSKNTDSQASALMGSGFNIFFNPSHIWQKELSQSITGRNRTPKGMLKNVCVVMTKFQQSTSMPHPWHLDTLIPELDLQ